MSKRSHYEIEREANIARNRALLEELGLDKAVKDLGVRAKSKNTKPKPVQPVKRPKRVKTEPEAPRRQSSRLHRAPIDPNESPRKRQKREQEERAREAEARLEAEERARIAKLPRTHPLDLQTLVGEAGMKEVPNLVTTFETVIGTSHPQRVGDFDAFVFNDHKKEELEVADLRSKFQGLKIVAHAKVTQDRVYSSIYHPEVTKDLIFFGDKHGQLGIWDARAPPEELTDEDGELVSSDPEAGKCWQLQVHWPATAKSSISCLRLDPLNAHNLFTSSYDCTIRALSFETGISRQIHSTEEALPCSIDFVPTGNEMWISDDDGRATHLDMRESKFIARRYGLSDQKIGCISINPTRPHFLLTASNSRALRIWDSRNLRHLHFGTVREFDYGRVSAFLETKNGNGCLRAEWRHDKSVSSAYWDPRGHSIVSTSYDDTIRLWEIESFKFESASAFPSSRPFGQIRHNCQTGKWLTILRAQWSPNIDVYPHFTIGNMKRSLDVYSEKGDLIARLSDPTKVSAVQAVTCSHPSVVERAASGNASGRCVLWAPPDPDTTSDTPDSG